MILMCCADAGDRHLSKNSVAGELIITRRRKEKFELAGTESVVGKMPIQSSRFITGEKSTYELIRKLERATQADG